MKSMTKSIVLSAMFLAIGLILPLFTAQIPQIGQIGRASCRERV